MIFTALSATLKAQSAFDSVFTTNCGHFYLTTSGPRTVTTFMLFFLLNIPYGYRSPLHSIT